MPPRSKKQALQASTSDVATPKEEEVEHVKVNLADPGSLKAALDDYARGVVLEHGYEENISISNIKIALGLAAIACALFAQFGPGKFPANWWQVLFCVGAYVVFNTALNVYSSRVEGAAFLVTKQRRGEAYPLYMTSSMERYDHKYTLIINNGRYPPASQKKEVRLTDSVASFFHADGYLSEAAFRPKVEALLQQYESSDSKKAQ